MSTGMDLSQFYAMFFDEAEELLADMEQLLLAIDTGQPDSDQLNGIFRAAHSIKGGAGTFGCFPELAQTTHLLENILDDVRNGEVALRKDMVDLFLEAKDVLTDQLGAYRAGEEPDAQAYERICRQLQELALEKHGQNTPAEPAVAAPPAELLPPEPELGAEPDTPPAADDETLRVLRIRLLKLNDADRIALEAEMAIMGNVLDKHVASDCLTLWIETTASESDIRAVCAFVVNEDQVDVQAANTPAAEAADNGAVPPPDSPPARSGSGSGGGASNRSASTSNTLRVGVEKVDQIINLVGELVITQAMLVQTVAGMDPAQHDRLLHSVEQLERNARELQEAVMSIRMMPMDYVFSRFPRVVRENAAAMGKEIRLVTEGQATELDKSLIERIIDPLTHLVRNSIDHGIERPEERVAAGKPAEGVLTLSAEHSGGHIVIQVSDDGGGLSRERILAKALQQGLPVSESTPDDDLWQVVFAPGFSTAEKITDISGRGVGMDVVRRNILSMGGHIHLSSTPGRGTSTRIVLPLTLAILDGMSVRVGEETFILPLSHVMESMQPLPEQIKRISETEQVLQVRGDYLPLISLHRIFNVDDAETDPTRAIAVILKTEELRFALIVDHLVAQHQVVVKNLEANYRKVPGVSAATILGDGSVALIIDVFALTRLNHGNSLQESQALLATP